MATTTTVVTTSTRERVSIPRINALQWQVYQKEGGVPGNVKKKLSLGTGGSMSVDPTIEMETRLTHLPPWWRDDELVYHPNVEEGFILNGAVGLADRVYGP